MVKHTNSVFIFFCLFITSFAFSGEFTASVNRNQLALGESLTLILTLKEASTRTAPSLTNLGKAFTIISQQQSSNTVFINGKTSSTLTWRITILPQKEGDLKIPEITIDTSEGFLFTDEIAIHVTKKATNSTSYDAENITVKTHVSHAQPYKNQPFLYTAELSSRVDMMNIKMDTIHIEDAIIEISGEPKVYEKIVNGVRQGNVKFSYLIIPLKAGPLKIPSILIRGMIPAKKGTRNSSFFDDDDLNPFSMIHGFERLQPFGISTEEVVIDVQPAVAGMNPWIPATYFKIEEVLDNDSQVYRVGDPFNRSFKISAEGVKSSQLPSLQDQQIKDNNFKIYSDKPSLEDETEEGEIKSFRYEQYTLIPQHGGSLTLPEMTVIWWDVTKKEKTIAKIPSRTIEVLPAINNESDLILKPQQESFLSPVIQENSIKRDPFLYILIASLGVLLLFAVFWGIFLQKKIANLTEKKDCNQPSAEEKKQEVQKKEPQKKDLLKGKTVKTKKEVKDKKEKLPDLNPT